MAKQKLKELKIQTDCGIITVQEYDDEIANGVKIFLGDTIVAMVDCYRKKQLPTVIQAWLSEIIPGNGTIVDDDNVDMDELICNYLSDKYGYCVNSFRFERQGDLFQIFDINWDIDIPEARLLVYGPEGPDCDEPQQCIPIN